MRVRHLARRLQPIGACQLSEQFATAQFARLAFDDDGDGEQSTFGLALQILNSLQGNDSIDGLHGRVLKQQFDRSAALRMVTLVDHSSIGKNQHVKATDNAFHRGPDAKRRPAVVEPFSSNVHSSLFVLAIEFFPGWLRSRLQSPFAAQVAGPHGLSIQGREGPLKA